MKQPAFNIEKAVIEDAEEILALQKLAYMSEAEIIHDCTIPPLTHILTLVYLEKRHYAPGRLPH